MTKKPTKRLTPEQKATKQKKQQRETIKALKVEALTIPKALPTNVFAIFMSGKKGSLVDHISSFKSLPTAEVEVWIPLFSFLHEHCFPKDEVLFSDSHRL